MNTSPWISVIVCTHNRGNSLKKTLESLKSQSLPTDYFEVIIIDNHSTDNTAEVARDFTKTQTNFVYKFEPKLGLNSARNRGWHEAQGKWVAYIDDDAYAEENWLEVWLEVLANDNAKIVCAGGKVLGDWMGPRPEWVPSQYEMSYTICDYGDTPRFLSSNEVILGTHMLFNKECLENFAGFDENIGRVGDGLGTYAGDETALIHRFRLTGFTPFYLPRAIVWHEVGHTRTSRKWLVRRVFMEGKTQPVLDFYFNRQNPYKWRRALYDIRLELRYIVSAFYAWISGDSEAKTVQHFCSAALRIGRASEEIKGIMSSGSHS